jgi:hypothetical protein
MMLVDTRARGPLPARGVNHPPVSLTVFSIWRSEE